MPTLVTKAAGDLTALASPFIGDYQPLHVKVDVSAFTTREVDANGYLKPGVPMSLLGVPLAGIEGEVPAVTIESAKIAANNVAGTLATSQDVFVACGVTGVVNRDVMEDNLGGVLSAPEIAALNGPNSKIVLSLT